MKPNFIVLFLLIILLACQSDSDVVAPESKGGESAPPLIPRQNIELTSVEKQLSESSNTFAFNLLKTVYADKDEKDKNILISPLSATLALSMLNNGAVGATGEEIRQTLGFGDVSNEVINSYAQKIVNAMQTLDPRGVFESANSIWIQNEFPVLNKFKQINQQYYEAEIQNVDFSKPSTVNLINNWTSEKTHGKIPEILNEIDPFTRLILSNALYFKGYWTEHFDKNLTFDAQFHTSTGEKQTVPTMKNTFHNHYTKVDNCAAAHLPFGNGAFSIVVVLPNEDTDIRTIIEQMDQEWWENITDYYGKAAVEMYSKNQIFVLNLEIPRFKLEYERTLNSDLMALGMQTSFSAEKADFSLISENKPLWISGVKQKTFAQMDEDGMEAAAVTIVGTLGANLYEYIPVDFKVNRPFLYFIKEQSTGLIFFAGVMNKIS